MSNSKIRGKSKWQVASGSSRLVVMIKVSLTYRGSSYIANRAAVSQDFASPDSA
jgi:hypothetical protein